MAIYLGPDQIAECMRSGTKCRASDLVRDGRNPSLLVLPEWADPPHPQEIPYVPDDIEGSSDNPISPDNLPATALNLAGNYFGGIMALSWNTATLWGPRAKSYVLRRSTDGGAFSDISTNLVDYTNVTGHVANIGIQKDYGRVFWVNTAYTDRTVLASHIYVYQVAAVDDIGDDVAVSNQVTLNTATGIVTGSVGPVPSVAVTVVLLHMEGIEGGTIFTDSSSHALSLSPAFFAHTTTSKFKWGTSCYVATPNVGFCYYIQPAAAPLPDAYQVTDGVDFTIEGWFLRNGLGGGFAEGCTVFALCDASHQYVELFIDNTTGFLNCQFLHGDGTSLFNPIRLLAGSTNICDNAWHHVAVSRNGTTYALYVDGLRVDTAVDATTVGHGYGRFSSGGTVTDSFRNKGLDCFIDEVRFVQGAALYIGPTYTVPTGPFTG